VRFELGTHAKAADERFRQLASDGAAERIWRRDAAFWGGDDGRRASVASFLGWLDVASRMRERLPELQHFADDVRSAGFDACVLLGMGGSSLAPEVLRQSIGPGAGWPRLYVLDTTDPATIGDVERRINPARTLFFVSSKSGTTLEPLCLFAYFWELVRSAKGESAGQNFVTITDAGTPLETLAREHDFRHVFTNPGDIGGRYSALSYFGLAPASATGVDVAKLLDRGIAAADDARVRDNDALRLGATLGELALQGRNKLTFMIPSPLASFGLWVEQLIAESTGKEGRGILPVAGEPLASPKHYGDDRVFVQLWLEGGDNAELDALAGALAAEGRPVVVIDVEDAYDLGREFFRWEFAVAVAGQVLDINPLDQPNVQESKDNTKRVLDEFERSRQLDIEGVEGRRAPIAIGADGRMQEDIDAAIRSLFDSLRPHDYFAITAYIEQTDESDERFADVRGAIRDARRVATTLGYGPRFLHSTGQLHKGGPPEGVFLQVTADDVPDRRIPTEPFTFGQLKRAQAIGDLQALRKHGRPALRVHLGTDIPAGLVQLATAIHSGVSGERERARR
jgi:glucose-6-phosphate isomerase